MLGRCARTVIKWLLIPKFIRNLSGLRTVIFAKAKIRPITPVLKITWRPRYSVWFYLYLFFILIAPFFQVKEAFAPIMPPVAEIDKRIVHLENFLAGYNSPLVGHAGTFISTADQYGLDWRLLPAIAGTESILGKRYIVGTYNPFGWGSGKIRFKSWEHAIETVGQKLYEKYYLNGTRPLTIEQVGGIYAESPHWPRSVRFWIRKIEADQISAVLN